MASHRDALTLHLTVATDSTLADQRARTPQTRVRTAAATTRPVTPPARRLRTENAPTARGPGANVTANMSVPTSLFTRAPRPGGPVP